VAAALQVVAALIEDEQGRVLIARRPEGRHHAGLWEFPGGKIEPGERALQALQRELREELGIEVLTAVRVMTVVEQRASGDLHLQAWRVLDWHGTPVPREHPAIDWVRPEHLPLASMPPADVPIARTLCLPREYLITPDAAMLPASGLSRGIAFALAEGIRLVRLRAAAPDIRIAPALLQDTEDQVAAAGGVLLVDLADHGQSHGHTGVHLRSSELATLAARPVPPEVLLLASCHDAADLAQAERLGVDAVVLSPVSPTRSHPGAIPLGWHGFDALHAGTRLPAYALGGLDRAHHSRARAHGAIGIAAIHGLWPSAVRAGPP